MRSPAYLHHDLASKTLTGRLHQRTSRLLDASARHPAAEMTPTETIFHGTYLRLVFTLNVPP